MKIFLMIFISATFLNSVYTSGSSICELQKFCSDCIKAHPSCSWCSAPSNVSNSYFHCTDGTLNQCPAKDIENPRSSTTATTNRSFSSKTQIRPQNLLIKLRRGEVQKVNITFKKKVQYPLDLYYVMDLSNSMSDDLTILQSLGSNLVRQIKTNVTKNVYLGFGSFVDKVTMPYTSTLMKHLKNPCDTCSAVFDYKHQLKLTNVEQEFVDVIKSTTISGNIDSPEGGFDALMQIAVCQSLIGWRKDALRVILYASDASPHIAMDGKLAAILEANDQQCYMKEGFNKLLPSDTVYTKGNQFDYPSLGQIKNVFKENKLQAIFAVTKDVHPLYEDLVKVLPNSVASQLESDSSNVVQVISTSYDKLKSKISISKPEVSKNIEMKYRVLCPRSKTWRENELSCDNAGNLQDEAIFQFEFKLEQCPSTTYETAKISSSFVPDEVELRFEYLCSCNCSESLEKSSQSCSLKGDFECGSCHCGDGFFGKQCQCKTTEQRNMTDESCRKTPSSKKLCSGNGNCECGACQCNKGSFGNFCECVHTGCASNREGLCGGSNRGDCQNCDQKKECICKSGFSLGPDGTCMCNPQLCSPTNSKDGDICSNHGTCSCDNCICESIYAGEFCNECIYPTCMDIDHTCKSEVFFQCAQCVQDSLRKSQNAAVDCKGSCSNNSINFIEVKKLPSCGKIQCANKTEECKVCQYLDPKYTSSCKVPALTASCHVSFLISWNTLINQFEIYVRKFNQETDCDKAINPLSIVLATTGGIFLVGLVTLIIIKLLRDWHARREYMNFVTEQRQSKWNQNNNPLFKQATTTVANPVFVDE